jgi:hypothetical protein
MTAVDARPRNTAIYACIYDVCVEHGAMSSSRWALFIFDFLRSEKDIIAEDDPDFFNLASRCQKSKRKAAVAVTADDDDDIGRFARGS